MTVAESVANLACVGATAKAVVNCLNFGNPEHPEVMWQLSESIDGMTEACLGLGLPVIGGNVSLYNESGGHDIDPTPVVGLLGVIDSLVAPPPHSGNASSSARPIRSSPSSSSAARVTVACTTASCSSAMSTQSGSTSRRRRHDAEWSTRSLTGPTFVGSIARRVEPTYKLSPTQGLVFRAASRV